MNRSIIIGFLKKIHLYTVVKGGVHGLIEIKYFIINKFFSEQKVAQLYWKDTKNYDYDELCPERYAEQINFAKKYFIPKINKNDLIADVGACNGWFAFKVIPYVKEIKCYDISARQLNIAKKEASRSNIENISFELFDALHDRLHDRFNHIMIMGLFTAILDDSKVVDVLSYINTNNLHDDGMVLLKDTIYKHEGSKFYNGNVYKAMYRSEALYSSLYEKSGFKVVDKLILKEKDPEYDFMFCILAKA